MASLLKTKQLFTQPALYDGRESLLRLRISAVVNPFFLTIVMGLTFYRVPANFSQAP